MNRLSLILIATAVATGCTGQLPGSFRLAQQEELFSSQLQINTKIDLLWVVDNSSSMDVSQEKLRNGFDSFARRYMQPTWDIRVAVITTDAYLANPGFSSFLGQVIPGTLGYASPYMKSKTKSITNPIWDVASGTFKSGVKYSDLVPVWGPNYARLLSGVHDGPIPGLCFEGLPYFLHGVTQCAIRDDLSSNTGSANCLNPANGETSLTQCVNTFENNTIHTQRAIISTAPGPGVLGDPVKTAQWTDQLVNDFRINVTTGSVGFGSERGLSSVLQLLNDNEKTDTAFFRPGSLRGIVFVSDEDDQSLQIPNNPASPFSPWNHYRCDQASLESLNSSNIAAVSGVNGYCCSNPANNCRYGSEGTSCPVKVVDGVSHVISLCANPDYLIPVDSVKTQMDSFFTNLDQGNSSAGPNYFIVSIVPMSDASINAIQALHDQDDAAVGVSLKTKAVDRGDRYLALGQLVGNGSLALDISANDYSPVLDAIGNAIISKKSTFDLVRAPTSTEDMIVKVVHADGSSFIVPSDKLDISGKTLTITDETLVLTFASTDQILINYQPKTLY